MRGRPATRRRQDTGAGTSLREDTMGFDDKIENKAELLKGQGKEAVGRATDDEELMAEGQMEQAKGSIKQAGEKIKDIFKQ